VVATKGGMDMAGANGPDWGARASRRYLRRALEARIAQAAGEGAAILDVGGCSTRPGAEEASADEELRRVLMAVEIIRGRMPAMPVSLDTWRASVAREVLARLGPCIINDISAGERDPDMIPLVAAAGVPFIAMHMRGIPATMNLLTDYDDVGADVEEYFVRRLAALAVAGVERVVVDPGFGFAKTTAQNYELLAALPRLKALGRPLLAGLSRKRMIYNVTGGTPESALAWTCALNWQALAAGARILRVHDVREAVDVVKLFEYYDDRGKGHS
jgi:dihydropteroate synthase